MMWNQAIVKGALTKIGNGTWSGSTFTASVIEIGGHRIPNVRVAKCLLDHMEPGKEMELLICSSHIYGVKLSGKTYKEGAARQLGWALLVTATLGWMLVPLLVAFIFIRRFFAIYTF